MVKRDKYVRQATGSGGGGGKRWSGVSMKPCWSGECWRRKNGGASGGCWRLAKT